jgi:hypothetical protein
MPDRSRSLAAIRWGAALFVIAFLAACSGASSSPTPGQQSPIATLPTTVPATIATTVAPATPTPTSTPVPVVCTQSPCSVTMRDARPYGTLEVKVGTEVIWTSTCFGPCTVTFRSGEIDSGEMAKGDTFKHTFDVPGSYPYYCQFDPAEMTGTIIVTQ